MRKDPSNYTFRNRENEQLIKYPGDINGNAFVLDTLNNCDVYILDYTAQIQVDDCINCRIFVGPCDGSVFFRDCKDCYVCVACRQLRTRDCQNMSIATYCSTDPSIETSRGLLFSCWRGAYPGLVAHFAAAKLDPTNNTWDRIHDFNSMDPEVLEHGPSAHYCLDHSFQGWWVAPVEGEPECPVPFPAPEGSVSFPAFPPGYEPHVYEEAPAYHGENEWAEAPADTAAGQATAEGEPEEVFTHDLKTGAGEAPTVVCGVATAEVADGGLGDFRIPPPSAAAAMSKFGDEEFDLDDEEEEEIPIAVEEEWAPHAADEKEAEPKSEALTFPELAFPAPVPEPDATPQLPTAPEAPVIDHETVLTEGVGIESLPTPLFPDFGDFSLPSTEPLSFVAASAIAGDPSPSSNPFDACSDIGQAAVAAEQGPAEEDIFAPPRPPSPESPLTSVEPQIFSNAPPEVQFSPPPAAAGEPRFGVGPVSFPSDDFFLAISAPRASGLVPPPVAPSTFEERPTETFDFFAEPSSLSASRSDSSFPEPPRVEPELPAVEVAAATPLTFPIGSQFSPAPAAPTPLLTEPKGVSVSEAPSAAALQSHSPVVPAALVLSPVSASKARAVDPLDWRRSLAERLRQQDLDEEKEKDKVRAAAKSFIAETLRKRAESISKRHSQHLVDAKQTTAAEHQQHQPRRPVITGAAGAAFGNADWALAADLCSGSRPGAAAAAASGLRKTAVVSKDTSRMLHVLQELKARSLKAAL